MYTLLKKTYLVPLALAISCSTYAQEKKDNQLDVGLQLMTHGEARYGGLDEATSENPEPEKKAYFIMERTRLNIDYRRAFHTDGEPQGSSTQLEARVSAQHKGIWGQNGQGSFNFYEAWAKLSLRNGMFAQVGRQALSYDDERIIGPNDWAMAALSHDVLRLGYEGHGHKAHAILAYNQNAENTTGGTYYANGSQPYKTMHTLWYHYDVPKIYLGASILFMNIGLQGGLKGGEGDDVPRTRYQQLIGGYLSFKPRRLSVEASYYHQLGRNEHNTKINAWMASVSSQYSFNNHVSVLAGYDYLSGDPHFAVPGKGQIGMSRHSVIKGFNPVYGSHHKFYGMMDFFYVSTYLNGFTPGLQNLYAGAEYSPIKQLNLKVRYHYMATATKLEDIDKSLGHDVDLEASYQLMKDARISVGFSYMDGTETMERLKRSDEGNNLKWGWFSLTISPRIFTTKW